MLITGWGGGIGRATCLAFARNGANVLGFDLDDKWIGSVQEQAGEASKHIHAVAGDVTKASDVSNAVKMAERLFGHLDVAIAAAGIQVVAPLEETLEEEWERVLNVNLTGTWLLCKYSIRALRRAGGGSIICLGSTLGLHPRANLGAYCVSKAGVSMLVRVFGREVAADGIRVVAVCPTGVKTPLLQGIAEGIARHSSGTQGDAALLKDKPVRRWLEPEEVAEALVWMTHPASTPVVGSSIPLDFGSA